MADTARALVHDVGGLLALRLHQAMAESLSGRIEITDESRAMDALGLAPLLVPGEAESFKLTWPADFCLAQDIVSSRLRSGALGWCGLQLRRWFPVQSLAHQPGRGTPREVRPPMPGPPV